MCGNVVGPMLANCFAGWIFKISTRCFDQTFHRRCGPYVYMCFFLAVVRSNNPSAALDLHPNDQNLLRRTPLLYTDLEFALYAFSLILSTPFHCSLLRTRLLCCNVDAFRLLTTKYKMNF